MSLEGIDLEPAEEIYAMERSLSRGHSEVIPSMMRKLNVNTLLTSRSCREEPLSLLLNLITNTWRFTITSAKMLYHTESINMDPKTQRWCASRAAVFKALGHPTRVFIVQELSKGEECVCRLTEKVGVDISTVSKHLNILKAAGIVSDDKRGLQVFYKLRMPCVLGIFDCVDRIMEEDLRDKEALVR